MVSIGTFSHLVSLIFAAAVSADAWDTAIAEIAEALRDPAGRVGRVQSAALTFADGVARTTRGTLSPQADESYREYYGLLDEVLQDVERGPVGVVRTGAELVAPRSHSEFVADWVRPNDLEKGLFVRLTDDAMPISFVVAGADGAGPFETPSRATLIRELVPHLQHALRVHEHLSTLTIRTQDLRDALDRLRHGVIVVGSGMRIVYCNGVAEQRLTENKRVLLTDGGCLRATPRGTQRQLETAVAGAVDGDSLGVRFGSAVACERPPPHRPYILHVAPMTRASIDSGARCPIALVLVVDPDRDPLPAEPYLHQVCGFTNTEATVAHLLVLGHGVAPIADELSLSVATVKTHMRAIFAKTGTHRQAELVHFLLSGTA